MNEQAIRDAFDLFVANGYPDTYDNFKRLMQTNQVARKDAFDLFVANGYPDTIDNFNSLMGASVDGPVVKKKKKQSLYSPIKNLFSPLLRLLLLGYLHRYLHHKTRKLISM